jgi:hypothetical protein
MYTYIHTYIVMHHPSVTNDVMPRLAEYQVLSVRHGLMDVPYVLSVRHGLMDVPYVLSVRHGLMDVPYDVFYVLA